MSQNQPQYTSPVIISIASLINEQLLMIRAFAGIINYAWTDPQWGKISMKHRIDIVIV